MAKSNQNHVSRKHWMDAGDLASLVDEYRHHLVGLGHTRRMVINYDTSARHFAYWLSQAEIAVGNINEAVIDRFRQHRCRCAGKRRAKHVTRKYVGLVRRFVEFLAEHGVVLRAAKRAPAARDRRVFEFQGWLRQHHGISERTIELRGQLITRLLPALGDQTRSYNAHLIREVIVAETKRTSIGHVKSMATALRGYLRFLGARGLCRAGLEHAVPTIAQWRLSTLPRYVGASDVERLIGTCDLTTSLGIRDRAILLLLARLGLRAGDIVSLRLDDIDWRQATVSVCGKGRRETRLPLPQDVGDAVLDYLKRARPRVPDSRIFFMSNAPFRPLTRSHVVSQVVRRAIRKVGITVPSMGANLLRHSAATAMLRGGATLDMVATVLRHRSPNMTAHYAKVDIAMLQLAAQPWPGGA